MVDEQIEKKKEKESWMFSFFMAAGAVLVLFGLFFLYQAYRMESNSKPIPGPSFFPIQKETQNGINHAASSAANEEDLNEYAQYQEYCQRLEIISSERQIEENGFILIKEHVFPMETEAFGEVLFIPALDSACSRLVLFFAAPDGKILYYTEQLETNNQNRGKFNQLNEGIAAVSFQDMDDDGLIDILLVTFCTKEEEVSTGKRYKVGDVLFQNKQGFYRDYRLSNKINQFNMNKSIRFIVSFIKEGYSTEFLYKAATLEELTSNGFTIVSEQWGWWNFEKLGQLLVVPGIYRMAEYSIFMIYLVNKQGYIVWSFQPMEEYENLYDLQGVKCQDIDGDGLKDIVVLAQYTYEGEEGEMVVAKEYAIYYQRTGGFSADTEMKSWYHCEDNTDMKTLIEQARDFWGY